MILTLVQAVFTADDMSELMSIIREVERLNGKRV